MAGETINPNSPELQIASLVTETRTIVNETNIPLQGGERLTVNTDHEGYTVEDIKAQTILSPENPDITPPTNLPDFLRSNTFSLAQKLLPAGEVPTPATDEKEFNKQQHELIKKIIHHVGDGNFMATVTDAVREAGLTMQSNLSADIVVPSLHAALVEQTAEEIQRKKTEGKAGFTYETTDKNRREVYGKMRNNRQPGQEGLELIGDKMHAVNTMMKLEGITISVRDSFTVLQQALESSGTPAENERAKKMAEKLVDLIESKFGATADVQNFVTQYREVLADPNADVAKKESVLKQVDYQNYQKANTGDGKNFLTEAQNTDSTLPKDERTFSREIDRTVHEDLMAAQQIFNSMVPPEQRAVLVRLQVDLDTAKKNGDTAQVDQLTHKLVDTRRHFQRAILRANNVRPADGDIQFTADDEALAVTIQQRSREKVTYKNFSNGQEQTIQRDHMNAVDANRVAAIDLLGALGLSPDALNTLKAEGTWDSIVALRDSIKRLPKDQQTTEFQTALASVGIDIPLTTDPAIAEAFTSALNTDVRLAGALDDTQQRLESRFQKLTGGVLPQNLVLTEFREMGLKGLELLNRRGETKREQTGDGTPEAGIPDELKDLKIPQRDIEQAAQQGNTAVDSLANIAGVGQPDADPDSDKALRKLDRKEIGKKLKEKNRRKLQEASGMTDVEIDAQRIEDEFNRIARRDTILFVSGERVGGIEADKVEEEFNRITKLIAENIISEDGTITAENEAVARQLLEIKIEEIKQEITDTTPVVETYTQQLSELDEIVKKLMAASNQREIDGTEDSHDYENDADFKAMNEKIDQLKEQIHNDNPDLKTDIIDAVIRIRGTKKASSEKQNTLKNKLTNAGSRLMDAFKAIENDPEVTLEQQQAEAEATLDQIEEALTTKYGTDALEKFDQRMSEWESINLEELPPERQDEIRNRWDIFAQDLAEITFGNKDQESIDKVKAALDFYMEEAQADANEQIAEAHIEADDTSTQASAEKKKGFRQRAKEVVKKLISRKDKTDASAESAELFTSQESFDRTPEHLSPTERMGAFLVAEGTDKGLRRKNNEDSLKTQRIKVEIGKDPTTGESIYVEETLMLVADGAGGHEGGEKASQLAKDTFIQRYQERLADGQDTHNAIQGAIQDAHHAITSTYPVATPMTTIVVATLKDDGTYAIANVGDSRAYAIGADTITQLSEDHNAIAVYLRRPENYSYSVFENAFNTLQQGTGHTESQILEALGLNSKSQLYDTLQSYLDSSRSMNDLYAKIQGTWLANLLQINAITTALGDSTDAVRISYRKGQLNSGDRLLLCSDGLWDMTASTTPDNDEPIIHRLATSTDDPSESVRRLIAYANQQGGVDNVSVTIAQFEPEQAATTAVPAEQEAIPDVEGATETIITSAPPINYDTMDLDTPPFLSQRNRVSPRPTQQPASSAPPNAPASSQTQEAAAELTPEQLDEAVRIQNEQIREAIRAIDQIDDFDIKIDIAELVQLRSEEVRTRLTTQQAADDIHQTAQKILTYLQANGDTTTSIENIEQAIEVLSANTALETDRRIELIDALHKTKLASEVDALVEDTISARSNFDSITERKKELIQKIRKATKNRFTSKEIQHLILRNSLQKVFTLPVDSAEVQPTPSSALERMQEARQLISISELKTKIDEVIKKSITEGTPSAETHKQREELIQQLRQETKTQLSEADIRAALGEMIIERLDLENTVEAAHEEPEAPAPLDELSEKGDSQPEKKIKPPKKYTLAPRIKRIMDERRKDAAELEAQIAAAENEGMVVHEQPVNTEEQALLRRLEAAIGPEHMTVQQVKDELVKRIQERFLNDPTQVTSVAAENIRKEVAKLDLSKDEDLLKVLAELEALPSDKAFPNRKRITFNIEEDPESKEPVIVISPATKPRIIGIGEDMLQIINPPEQGGWKVKIVEATEPSENAKSQGLSSRIKFDPGVQAQLRAEIDPALIVEDSRLKPFYKKIEGINTAEISIQRDIQTIIDAGHDIETYAAEAALSLSEGAFDASAYDDFNTMAEQITKTLEAREEDPWTGDHEENVQAVKKALMAEIKIKQEQLKEDKTAGEVSNNGDETTEDEGNDDSGSGDVGGGQEPTPHTDDPTSPSSASPTDSSSASEEGDLHIEETPEERAQREYKDAITAASDSEIGTKADRPVTTKVTGTPGAPSGYENESPYEDLHGEMAAQFETEEPLIQEETPSEEITDDDQEKEAPLSFDEQLHEEHITPTGRIQGPVGSLIGLSETSNSKNFTTATLVNKIQYNQKTGYDVLARGDNNVARWDVKDNSVLIIEGTNQNALINLSNNARAFIHTSSIDSKSKTTVSINNEQQSIDTAIRATDTAHLIIEENDGLVQLYKHASAHIRNHNGGIIVLHDGASLFISDKLTGTIDFVNEGAHTVAVAFEGVSDHLHQQFYTLPRQGNLTADQYAQAHNADRFSLNGKEYITITTNARNNNSDTARATFEIQGDTLVFVDARRTDTELQDRLERKLRVPAQETASSYDIPAEPGIPGGGFEGVSEQLPSSPSEYDQTQLEQAIKHELLQRNAPEWFVNSFRAVAINLGLTDIKFLQQGAYAAGIRARTADGNDVVIKMPKFVPSNQTNTYEYSFEESNQKIEQENNVLLELHKKLADRPSRKNIPQPLGQYRVSVQSDEGPHEVNIHVQSLAKGERYWTKDKNQALAQLTQLTQLCADLDAVDVWHADLKPDAFFWDETTQTLTVIDWNVIYTSKTQYQSGPLGKTDRRAQFWNSYVGSIMDLHKSGYFPDSLEPFYKLLATDNASLSTQTKIAIPEPHGWRQIGSVKSALEWFTLKRVQIAQSTLEEPILPAYQTEQLDGIKAEQTPTELITQLEKELSIVAAPDFFLELTDPDRHAQLQQIENWIHTIQKSYEDIENIPKNAIPLLAARLKVIMEQLGIQIPTDPNVHLSDIIPEAKYKAIIDELLKRYPPKLV